LPLNSRTLALASTFVAVGAVTRVVLGNIALESPVPLYGVIIKTGLTETLTITNGIACGPLAGFLTGSLIIVVSDLFMIPGPWTPFIAAIIGLLGFLAGMARGWVKNPKALNLAALAVPLTVLSEFLQNSWVSLFYNFPVLVTMISGLPALVTALINNLILMTTAGPRIVRLIQAVTKNASVPSSS